MPTLQRVKKVKKKVLTEAEYLKMKQQKALTDQAKRIERTTETVMQENATSNGKTLLESYEKLVNKKLNVENAIVEGYKSYKSLTKEDLGTGIIDHKAKLQKILENYDLDTLKATDAARYAEVKAIMENTVAQATNTADITPVYSYQIPIIMKTYWKLALKEFASVQPIAGRRGSVRWLRYKYSSVVPPRSADRLAQGYLPENYIAYDLESSVWAETARRIETDRLIKLSYDAANTAWKGNWMITDINGNVKTSTEMPDEYILDTNGDPVGVKAFNGQFNDPRGLKIVTGISHKHYEINKYASAGFKIALIKKIGTTETILELIDNNRQNAMPTNIGGEPYVQYTLNPTFKDGTTEVTLNITFAVKANAATEEEWVQALDTHITISSTSGLDTNAEYYLVFTFDAYINREQILDTTMKFEMVEDIIETETHKLMGVINFEALISANRQHDLELEKLVLDFLSNLVTFNVDMKGLVTIRQSAKTESRVTEATWIDDLPTTWATSAGFFYQFLIQQINQTAAEVMEKSFRGYASKLLTRPKIAAKLFLTGMLDAKISDWLEKDDASLMVSGTLADKYDIFVNPYWYDEILVAYNAPNNDVKTGAIYAPFLPLMLAPVDPNIAAGGAYYFAAYNISGFKVIDPDCFGIINVTSSTT